MSTEFNDQGVNGRGDPDSHDVPQADPEVSDVRMALEPARASLEAAGFYAYGTFDDQSRRTIAVGDELGRIDVRLGADGLTVVMWNSSPGLFMEEENEWRRRALERLARRVVPRIAEGQLEPHQSATWSEEDHGVAVSLTFELPFHQMHDIGTLVRNRLPELDDLLTQVESQVLS
jgi:hypothetical protein